MPRLTRRQAARGGAATVAAAALALGLSACGSNVSTPPDMTALHYAGGATTGKSFVDCVAPGTYRSDGFGDTHVMYPTVNQRTFDASDTAGAEQGPITVVSKDNQEMKVPVSVTFTFKSSGDAQKDCQTLRIFHERLGLRYNAAWTGDEETDKPEGNAGWLNLLRFVFGKPLDATLDREAQNYGWLQLWNDPATKIKVQTAVTSTLAELVKNQAGGDFFTISSVLIQKPDPVNGQLKANISQAQAEVAKANTAEAQARAQKAAADAQVAVATAQAKSVKAQIDVLGLDGYLRQRQIDANAANQQRAIDKGLNPYPPTIVPGAGR